MRNITSPALTWHCGGIQKVIAPHISSVFPAQGNPCRWGAVVTNDWCINDLQYVHRMCFCIPSMLLAGYQSLLTSITPHTSLLPKYFSSNT